MQIIEETQEIKVDIYQNDYAKLLLHLKKKGLLWHIFQC